MSSPTCWSTRAPGSARLRPSSIPRAAPTTTMHTEAAQLRLLTWFSPAFPVGAFGYSHGLETAIREGPRVDGETLEAWIAGLIEHGSGWTDAVLFKLAWSAADDLERADLAE